MTIDSSCQQILINEISRRGPIPFARFVELALYHPTGGYYMVGDSLVKGKEGDFYTSPRVSALFGEMLAEAFISMWKTLGSPRFSLIELGAGDGRLAADVMNAFEKNGMTKGLSCVVVEKNPARLSAALRRLSRFARVSGATDVHQLDEDRASDGCVFSNEFVDALPFHRLVKKDGEWREVAVSWTGERSPNSQRPVASGDRFEEVLISPTIPLPEGLPAMEEEIQGLLVRPQVGSFLAKASELISRGFILTIDYGSGRVDYWDPQRSGDQWGCFKEHHFDKDAYADVGHKDITADVDFTQLVEAGLVCGLEPLYFNTQANFLLSAGKRILESLDESSFPRRRESNPANSLDSHSRAKEPRGMFRGNDGIDVRLAAQHLLHPSGMGEAFQVLLQAKQAPLPEFLVGESNRLKRLGLNLGKIIPH